MLTERDRAYYESKTFEKSVRDKMLKEWREFGFSKGVAEGFRRGRIQVIQLMLETMSLEQIAQTLNMPVGDIQRLLNVSD